MDFTDDQKELIIFHIKVEQHQVVMSDNVKDDQYLRTQVI